MTKPPTPTLEDVSHAAGVSTATVSRCLNTPDKVTQNTRKRVMDAVAKLGYSPNFGARALAAKRTNTFGAVIPTMDNAVFARGMSAFQEELSQHGITLLVSCSSYRLDLEEEQIRTLIARGADALLLIGYARDPDLYAFLERQSVPVLVSWVYDPARSLPSIGFDNKRAMQNLASAVMDHGHKAIGMISADQTFNDRARGRVDGVRAAMALAGLSPDTLQIATAPYGIEAGRAGFRDLMQRRTRPTAVICGNDVQAAGALAEARDMGLRVPRDVSITGFDDMDIASVVDPALATVNVPYHDMGRSAARALIDMVRNGATPDSVELETQLCLRGSLGPAPR